MFINKTGSEHWEKGINCQDYGYPEHSYSIICDGCSEGKHSEVGAKLYCYLAGNCHLSEKEAFAKMIDLFGSSITAFKDYLCFTILELTTSVNEFTVRYCGDGYIILQDYEGNITFEELSDGEYPKYYIYHYLDKKYLKHYKDNVSFSQKSYSTQKYRKVGIASDGLRYILRTDKKLKQEFLNCLSSEKELKTKLFINRNYKIFKDDITIIF